MGFIQRYELDLELIHSHGTEATVGRPGPCGVLLCSTALCIPGSNSRLDFLASAQRGEVGACGARSVKFYSV
jgi:hypothetical protein